MKAEESILIERLKKGERTAFNELYGIFWAPLVNYAELIVGDENADDVVQEVFVRIWVGRDKLRILDEIGSENFAQRKQGADTF